MDSHLVTAFDEIIDILGNYVRSVDGESPTSAGEIWKSIVPLSDGKITSYLKEPKLYADQDGTILDEYQTFGRSYGLDASTTRTLSFQNGLIFNIANAALGVKEGKKHLRNHHTVVAGLYYDDGLDVETYENKPIFEQSISLPNGPAYTTAEVAFLPAHYGAKSPSEWVSAAARFLAEGRHLVQYLEEIDGPLFLDGSLYPKAIVANLWHARSQGSSVPGAWQDVAREIVQNFIEAIERQLQAGHSIFAVSKTFRTTELVDSIRVKQSNHGRNDRLPWLNDYMFAADLLTRPDDGNRLYTFTSWLKEEPTKRDGKSFEPLRDFDFDHLSPADLRRAFFFVRIPAEGVVFRVETPRFQLAELDRDERQRYQQAILSALIETRDIPKATKIADELARIEPQNRQKLIDRFSESLREKGITTTSVKDYNWDGRWNSLID